MAQVTVLSERLRGEGERPEEEASHHLSAIDNSHSHDRLVRVGCVSHTYASARSYDVCRRSRR